MARVTITEVQEIFETSMGTSQLNAFIQAATVTVTAILAGAGLTSQQLKEIERWLSAHFASVRDPKILSEKIGDAELSYQGRTGREDLGLDATFYGQQVKVLDTSGRLINLGKKQSKLEVVYEVTDA